MKQKRKEEFTTLQDEVGNRVICKNNGVRIVLSLKLRSETKYRRIGTVNIKSKTFDVRRIRAKHLFRAIGGYGFNHKLISEAKLFDKIKLSDELEQWKFPTSYLLTEGDFLYFKSPQGFERQIFLSLAQLERFKKAPKI